MATHRPTCKEHTLIIIQKKEKRKTRILLKKPKLHNIYTGDVHILKQQIRNYKKWRKYETKSELKSRQGQVCMANREFGNSQHTTYCTSYQNLEDILGDSLVESHVADTGCTVS